MHIIFKFREFHDIIIDLLGLGLAGVWVEVGVAIWAVAGAVNYLLYYHHHLHLN